MWVVKRENRLNVPLVPTVRVDRAESPKSEHNATEVDRRSAMITAPMVLIHRCPIDEPSVANNAVLGFERNPPADTRGPFPVL